MFKNTVAFCVLLLTFFGCKTVSVNSKTQTKTTQNVVLGSVGTIQSFILKSNYNNAAMPNYNKPIKVSAVAIPFTKQNFDAFKKATLLQNAIVNINYVDSSKTKPKFISLDIIDKVSVINTLNNKDNLEVKNYLSTDAEAKIVTQIAIAVKEQLLKSIVGADNLFLVQNGLKSYALQLYKNDKIVDVISFTDGVVFAYKTANCCWKANSNYRVNIVDLRDDSKSCSNKTYSSANRAKNKINYFKL